ncbi:MAG: SCO family protein [Xanthobacteraceae bacterium]
MRAIRISIICLALGAGFGAIAFIAGAAPRGAASGTGDPAVSDAQSLAFQPHLGTRLPLGTRLVDEAGRAVALGKYFTKSPVILILEYLRCTSLCGVTLHNLFADTLNPLPLEPGRDYQVVAVSIDPRDRPVDAAAARAKYAALFDRPGAAAGIHFLTGSAAASREIADTVGFRYRYDSLLDAYIHPAGFIIASPDGVITRYVEGIGISSHSLIGAFAAAEQDKSQSLFARVVLFCHVQGAPLGRFTVPVLAAFTAANLAAGFTLIGVFAAIRRRRHG